MIRFVPTEEKTVAQLYKIFGTVKLWEFPSVETNLFYSNNVKM